MEYYQRKSFNQFLSKPTSANLIAVLGVVAFLIQAIHLIHTRLPNFDEGSYLLKGLYFAEGVIKPFQPYGFWMNKMYMAFYPWGWIQSLTNPGLYFARVSTIFMNLFTLLGVWIAARRLGNRWLATGAIWVFALNPSLISIYSMANSQVLVTCLLTWVLVFTVGNNRPTWQLGIGMSLAGLLILTRENMVFVLPFLVIYIIWQNGWKKSLIPIVILLVVLVIGHLLYWPEIFYLWQRWLPINLFPNSSVESAISNSTNTDLGFARKLHSLSMALRIHYIAFIGSLMLFCLWPKKDGWIKSSHFGAAVFLGVTYAILLASHTWAALTSRACIYCTTTYFAFFDVIGILFCVVLLKNLNLQPGKLSALVVPITILASVTAIWFSLFEQIGSTLLLFPFPRIRNNQFISGWATIWDILNNKYKVDYSSARMYVPVLFGLLCGILIIVLLRLVFKKSHHRNLIKRTNFTSFTVLSSLAAAFILTPVTTQPYGEPFCQKDVLAAYEQFGAQLASIAPEGTKIYLDGPTTSVLLLYTPGVVILPPQINDLYSMRTSKNSNALLKAGTWNDEIARNWRDQSDVFIIENNRLESWKDYFQAGEFDRTILSTASSNCISEINYYIFKRIK
jgi:hypothetical protein